MSDETTPEKAIAPLRSKRTGVVPKPVPVGDVWVTITKAGAERVHDGKGGLLARGDRIAVDLETALSLEARHFAETD